MSLFLTIVFESPSPNKHSERKIQKQNVRFFDDLQFRFQHFFHKCIIWEVTAEKAIKKMTKYTWLSGKFGNIEKYTSYQQYTRFPYTVNVDRVWATFELKSPYYGIRRMQWFNFHYKGSYWSIYPYFTGWR